MVVKDGAEGALRVDPDGSVLVEAGRAVVPVDTTGAGDTFDAAYVDSFLRDLDPEECLRRACVAGALSTSAVGGTSAQPTLDQLSSGRDASMHHVTAEIESQPDAWRRAVAMLPTVSDALPQPGERVAVIGCGTSWFMAEAYAALREASGHGETDCFTASMLPTGRSYDRVVAISRSGTTTEVLEALCRHLRPAYGDHHLGLAADLRGERGDRRARLRRRAVGRPDRLRDHDADAPARLPRGGSRPGDRAGGAGARGRRPRRECRAAGSTPSSARAGPTASRGRPR